MNPFTLRTGLRHWSPIYKTSADIDSSGDPAAPDNVTHFTPQAVMPSGDGYIGTEGANLAKMCAIGTANSGHFLTHLASWSRVGSASYSGYNESNIGLWLPTHIATFKWEMGAQTGTASKFPDNTFYFAKNVELIDGDTSVRLITDTGTNGIASVTVDLEGAHRLSVGFDNTGVSEPANVNGFIGLF